MNVIKDTSFQNIYCSEPGCAICNKDSGKDHLIFDCNFVNITTNASITSSSNRENACGGAIYLDNLKSANLTKLSFFKIKSNKNYTFGETIYICGPLKSQTFLECISVTNCGKFNSFSTIINIDRTDMIFTSINSSKHNMINSYGEIFTGKLPYVNKLSMLISIGNTSNEDSRALALDSQASSIIECNYIIIKDCKNSGGVINCYTGTANMKNTTLINCAGNLIFYTYSFQVDLLDTNIVQSTINLNVRSNQNSKSVLSMNISSMSCLLNNFRSVTEQIDYTHRVEFICMMVILPIIYFD